MFTQMCTAGKKTMDRKEKIKKIFKPFKNRQVKTNQKAEMMIHL